MKYKLKLGLGTPPRHPYWLVSRLEAHVILVSASVQISLLGHDGLVVFMSVGTGRGIRTFGLELNNYHKSTKSNKKYLVFPPLRLKSLDLLHFPLLWPAFLRQLRDNFLSELTVISVASFVDRKWNMRPVSIPPRELLNFRLQQWDLGLVGHFSNLEYHTYSRV